jgi:hypothetical protein
MSKIYFSKLQELLQEGYSIVSKEPVAAPTPHERPGNLFVLKKNTKTRELTFALSELVEASRIVEKYGTKGDRKFFR